jgi:hypothetical protein
MPRGWQLIEGHHILPTLKYCLPQVMLSIVEDDALIVLAHLAPSGRRLDAEIQCLVRP